MRYSQSEKMQIIHLVEGSPVSIKQTLLELNIKPYSINSFIYVFLSG